MPKPTITGQIEAAGFGKFQWIVLTAFVLFVVSDGMEIVVTNVIWRVLPREEWGMDDDFRAVLVSAAYIGFMFGSIVGGIAGDWIGRLWIIYAHAIIFIPASIASAFSNSMYQLLVSRFIVGISMGAVLPTCVSLMSEFSPQAERGRAVIAIPGIAFGLGNVMVLGVGLALMGVCGEYGERCEWWRGVLVSGVLPDAIAIYLVLQYLPESPRFLLTKGRVEEAEGSIKAVAELNGNTHKLAEGGALEPLPEEEIASEGNADKQLAALFTSPIRNYMLIIIGLWSLFAFSMFSVSMLYPLVVEELGVSPAEEYFMMMQFCLAEPPMILFVMWLMQWGSRRPLLAALSVGACLVTAVAGFVVAGRSLVWVHASQIVTRAVSGAPYETFYVYAAELLPTTHRNFGVSFGNGCTKFVAMLVPLLAFPLFAWSSSAPFFLASGSCAIASIILLFVAPDPGVNLIDVVSQADKGERSPLISKEDGGLPDSAPLP